MPKQKKTETMWAIHGKYGLYTGTSILRREVIREFCRDRFITWDKAKKQGNKAVKVTMTYTV